MRGNNERSTISVQAEEQVYAKPDIARFSFLIKKEAPSLKEAQKVISARVSSILEALKKLGVKEKDIKTEQYRIFPKYEWVKVKKKYEESPEGIIYFPNQKEKRIITAYIVEQRIHLKLRKFDIIPDILTKLAEEKVMELNGPYFEIENKDKLKEEARLKAIQKAKAKAKRLAKELGVKLGRVISFNEEGNPITYRKYPIMAKSIALNVEEALPSPELPSGENKIQARVRITYQIR